MTWLVLDQNPLAALPPPPQNPGPRGPAVAHAPCPLPQPPYLPSECPASDNAPKPVAMNAPHPAEQLPKGLSFGIEIPPPQEPTPHEPAAFSDEQEPLTQFPYPSGSSHAHDAVVASIFGGIEWKELISF